jgi:hypothetical protein
MPSESRKPSRLLTSGIGKDCWDGGAVLLVFGIPPPVGLLDEMEAQVQKHPLAR